jgi:hypothetical protein
VLDLARNLDRYPVVTNSAPRAEKWRERAHEIERVWPHIEPTMEHLGYDVTVRP